MAALPLQLEIQGSGGNFTFLVPPRFEHRREVRWKRAANPPVVEEFLDTWDLPGALLVSSNGTVATLWTEWLAFQARLETRGSQPTYARIMRDPAGANVAVLTLGPTSGYEQLRFETVESGIAPNDAVAAATWRVVIPVNLKISAVLKKPDSNGIVGWDQVVRLTMDSAGLRTLEWETTVTTAEGTDAEAKVRTFGLIPIAVYGDSYSFLTNDDDGVEVIVTDADEQNSRTPTVATGTCRIKQWGVSIGTSGPGTSPGEVEIEIVTERESGRETIVRTATAVGPGAQGFCEAQRPAGLAIGKERITERQATRFYEIRWEQARSTSTEGEEPALTRGVIRVQVSGGRQDPEFEPACGGYLPVRFTTARLPYTITVSFEGTGPSASEPEDLPLPRILEPSTGLYFVPSESSEDLAPYVSEPAKGGASAATFRREARAVYRSATPPPRDLVTSLHRNPVPNWFLE